LGTLPKIAFFGNGFQQMQFNELLFHLTKALNLLHKQDSELLRMGANERTITARLGMYLQNEIHNWHVDCEYNRIGSNGESKRLQGLAKKTDIPWNDLSAKTIFPDIIVHRRTETNKENNLLAIEVKVASDAGDTDIEKLNVYSAFFQYALFLRVAYQQKTAYQRSNGETLLHAQRLNDFSE
jgi:hypothetical protein